MAGLQNLRVILIGGSSHTGKSTLAHALADRLGWACRSTDQLARHPGRPWQTPPKSVPEHVAAHYLSLSAEELVADVVGHYTGTVWPLVEELVTAHATDYARAGLVVEGSAVLPELFVTLNTDKVAAIWLTAGDELFRQRIYQSSAYDTKFAVEREMVTSFLERARRFNTRIVDDVERLKLISIHVVEPSSMESLADRCLVLLQIHGPDMR